MSKKLLYRQGDTLYFSVDETEFEQAIKAPDLTDPVKNQEVVFALGERTGHRHRMGLKRGDRAFRQGNLEDGGATHFVSLRGNRTVLHEEHAPVELPAGNYIVEIQRAYEPGEIRNVAD